MYLYPLRWRQKRHERFLKYISNYSKCVFFDFESCFVQYNTSASPRDRAAVLTDTKKLFSERRSKIRNRVQPWTLTYEYDSFYIFLYMLPPKAANRTREETEAYHRTKQLSKTKNTHFNNSKFISKPFTPFMPPTKWIEVHPRVAELGSH